MSPRTFIFTLSKSELFNKSFKYHFNRDDLDEAILEYERRNRKFGAK